MYDFYLDIFSHYFVISSPKGKAKDIIKHLDEYCTQMGYDRGSNYTVIRIFRSCTDDGEEYHYHISVLDYLRTIIISLGYGNEGYKVTKHAIPTPTYIDAPIREGWVPRDYQEPIIQYIQDPGHIKFVGLSMGGGKTSLSLMAISKMRMKTMILVKPTFMDKWTSDVITVLDVKPEEITTIRGGDSLRELIDLNIKGRDKSKFIIMSLTTYDLYINYFEKFHHEILDMGYGCEPCDFLETCGIGVVLVDELHLCYAQQFNAMLYMNCHKYIGLSGTFFTKDRQLEKMYFMGIPLNIRYTETMTEKYIYVTAISYRFKDPDKIKYKDFGSNMYSQSAFEKSIMRDKDICERYLDMIASQVERSYIDKYHKGDRCLVFAGTIKMCELIRDKLRLKFPSMWIEKYTAEDPYEYAIEPDIRISTIGSIGVGIDIPKLTTALMTVSIDSIQASRQSTGRLRKIADRDVHFYYLYCNQIDKHIRVHHGKRKSLGPISKNFSERHYPSYI